MLRFLFTCVITFICATVHAGVADCSADTAQTPTFTEGIMQTRISFPGNPMNELLSTIDFSKGNVQDQLTALQDVQNSEAYSKKIQAAISKMTAAEQQAMGQMMMAALMSPLYATIYFDKEKALAKAHALNYTMESFMSTTEGTGKMVAISNDNKESAAITFTASSLKEVWQKETADAEHYTVQWLNTVEKVSGVPCKKVIYTRKGGGTNKGGAQLAEKLIAWYSPQVSNRINFAHPFYLDIPHGVLKIEVQYDKGGKNRMIYEVTKMEQTKLGSSHFAMTDVQPEINWDTNQIQASTSMLKVLMSMGSEE